VLTAPEDVAAEFIASEIVEPDTDTCAGLKLFV
jgi:hypothetical protein